MANLRRWGGLYLLIALFLSSWVGHFVAQMAAVRADAEEHGQAFQMSDFLIQFTASTLENWQSEWLQLAVQSAVLVLLAGKIFQKSEEQEISNMKRAVREVLAEDRASLP